MGGSDYSTWNVAIATHFLGGQWRNRPLYLDLDKGTLERIAAHVGDSASDPEAAFAAAVRRTLNFESRQGMTFGRHVDHLHRWSLGEQGGPPPFMGLLAFFTLVAESMTSDERFRPTNYYGRLAQALGVDGDARRKQRVQRDFRSQSHIFWDALNGLLIERDGQLGRPTAFAFDARVHVGIPISQALVREDDRRHFPDLFSDHGLSPGSFPVDDMVELLDDWLPRSNISSALRHLWRSSADVRERIATVACHELESWDGVVAHGSALGRRRIPIKLVANIRTHLRPRLDLELRIRCDAKCFNSQLFLREDSGEAERAALGGVSVSLVESEHDGWGEFIESDRISLPDVLIANLALRDQAGRSEFERRAGQIVIFEFDQEKQWFVEVDRISLVAKHTLLVRRRLESDVFELVRQQARPGWRHYDAKSVDGCPDGWSLFHDVSLMDCPDVQSIDLRPLRPTATAAIAFSGGLALPEYRTWHATRPPEVSFSVETDRTISALLHPVYQELASKKQDITLGNFTRAGVVKLSESDVPAGEYRVAVYEIDPSGKRSARPIASSSLRLRSADRARPLAPIDGLRRPVVTDPNRATLSAVSARADAPDPMVTGCLVELEHEPGQIHPLPPARLNRTSYDEDLEEAPVRATGSLSGSAPPCFGGSGAHHWLYVEPGIADENRRRLAFCKHCRLEQWHNTRPPRLRRSSRAAATSVGPSVKPRRVPRVAVEGIEEETRADLDTVLDALSLLGKGTGTSFAALVRHVDDRPWFASELAWKLTGLGHVEVMLDQSARRMERWAIAPPVLAGLPDRGTAVLAGFRPPQLLDRLQADVEALGGSFRIDRLDGVPSRVAVRGLRCEDLAVIAESASSALGFRVSVVDNVAARFLSALPHISNLVDVLPVWPLPLDGAERFDAATGRWARADQTRMAGAYRTRDFPRIYAFVPPTTNGSAAVRLGTPRLVKHLEALRSGVSVVAYCPDRRELATRLGAQLPGLYERVVILCSGAPPRRFDDGTQRYSNVPPEIAVGLWTRLQPTQGWR